jgi:hypothetical protein
MWFIALCGFLLSILILGNVGAAMWGYFVRGDVLAGAPIGIGICIAVVCVVAICLPIVIILTGMK